MRVWSVLSTVYYTLHLKFMIFSRHFIFLYKSFEINLCCLVTTVECTGITLSNLCLLQSFACNINMGKVVCNKPGLYEIASGVLSRSSVNSFLAQPRSPQKSLLFSFVSFCGVMFLLWYVFFFIFLSFCFDLCPEIKDDDDDDEDEDEGDDTHAKGGKSDSDASQGKHSEL